MLINNHLDVSVLENFHVAEAFKLIKSKEDYNIFCELEKEEYKIMRKRIIECVLATDMTFHSKQLTYLKVKIQNFNISEGENVNAIFEQLEPLALFAAQQEFLNIIIHACDISNPTKPFEVYKNWYDRVMEEFWEQGDKEKALKMPCSFLCDRDTITKPNAQLGFIEGICTPFLNAFLQFFPKLDFLVKNMNENKVILKKLKEEEDQIKAKIGKKN
jgi:cAMP-specific phosphodiesterase 4